MCTNKEAIENAAAPNQSENERITPTTDSSFKIKIY